MVLSASPSRESLEASMVFTETECETQPQMSNSECLWSDEDWDGYATPTGSQVDRRLRSNSNASRSARDNALRSVGGTTATSGNPQMQQNKQEQEEVRKPEFDCIDELEEGMSSDEKNGLRHQLEFLSMKDRQIVSLEETVTALQSQLEEANAYVDQVDIEAEQQYSELTREIDELYDLVDLKDKEIAALREQLQDKERELEKSEERSESQKTSSVRHQSIIESTRDELDKEKNRVQKLQKDKERLASEVVTLKQKIETDKEALLAKDAMITLELEDVQRELKKQKDILSGTAVAQIIDRCEGRVLALENDVREREVIIHTQQCIINELKRTAHSPQHSKKHTSVMGSGGSSSESFSQEMDPSTRNSILKFILSDRNSQLANIYALGRVLNLNRQEESYLERSLAEQRDRYL